MRRWLDRLYDAAAYLAALFLMGTLAMVLTSVLGRLLGFQLRGSDAYAGYCMAGAGFLALAHTLTRGEHIRVNLVLEHVGPRARRALERWALAVATLLAVALAYFSIRLAWQSYALHDISTGNDATPLWLPQLSMALGTVIFAIAFIDRLVQGVAAMGPREKSNDEPAHVE
jgi:TRAP-type C4-dicarboxylate transport system permease small subunit